MLTLVHPSRDGQGGDPPKPRTRRPSVSLTSTEASGLSAALKNLHARFTWQRLANMTGVCVDTLRYAANGHTRGSPGLAVLVARVAGLPVDRILTPGPAPIASCPHCGGALEAK